MSVLKLLFLFAASSIASANDVFYGLEIDQENNHFYGMHLEE